jgi:hypothetical protein
MAALETRHGRLPGHVRAGSTTLDILPAGPHPRHLHRQTATQRTTTNSAELISRMKNTVAPEGVAR